MTKNNKKMLLQLIWFNRKGKEYTGALFGVLFYNCKNAAKFAELHVCVC